MNGKYRHRIHIILRGRKQRVPAQNFAQPVSLGIKMSQSQDSTATIAEVPVALEGPDFHSLGKVGDQYLLTHERVDRTFRGLVVATKLDDERQDFIEKWLKQQKDVLDSQALTVNQWLEAIRSRFTQETEYRLLMNLIIGISYMRERGRHSTELEDEFSLKFIWPHIYAALTHTNSLFKPSRSSAGFVFIPLCSLVKDGAIDELWRLHVWLPGSKPADPAFSVHGHHAFGQSWILAGEGTNHRWSVDAVADKAEATHAEYRVSWDDGQGAGAGPGYKTHQVSSTVVNTHRYFRAAHLGAEAERRGMTYTVSQDEWHSSSVSPDGVFATLFVFDAHRGANKNAAILGPRDGGSFTASKKVSEGRTAEGVARSVELIRRWEDCVAAFRASQRDESEEGECTATRRGAYDQAVSLCRDEPDFPNRDYYVKRTLDEWESAASRTNV